MGIQNLKCCLPLLSLPIPPFIFFLFSLCLSLQGVSNVGYPLCLTMNLSKLCLLYGVYACSVDMTIR